MKYVLAAIAGIWIADGLSLMLAPRLVMARLREVLALSPKILKWQVLVAALGVMLVLGTQDMKFQSLWWVVGLAMVIKGLFLALGPEYWRHKILEWCLHREDVDYRFWGLGLCTLAVLLLHALEWLEAG